MAANKICDRHFPSPFGGSAAVARFIDLCRALGR
jgi:hypothetical protein